MDTRLVETFLEIVSAGSFNIAAARLHIAQTTVSARIRALEEQLGRPLFVRHKGGAYLTEAGEQFLRHAPGFVQLARRMKRQVALPEGHSTLLTIGGEVGLWQSLVLDWVRQLRRRNPEIALRVHVDVPQDLIDRVAAGSVDAAVMHAPPHRTGLRAERLADEKLVLVTTDPAVDPFGSQFFVSADWGPRFNHDFASNFPELDSASVSFNLGPPALDYLLAMGGAGYFRHRVVISYVRSGRLHIVAGAPQFSYPVFLVSSTSFDDNMLLPAITSLREIMAPVLPG